MGNTHNKSDSHRHQKQAVHSEREGSTYTSQFSLSHFAGNLSGRSFVSTTSNQSVYSTSRPWSRVSRRRWNDTTLKNPLEGSKTAWPVAHKESIFLPEFPISTDLLQKDFELREVIAKGAFGEVRKVKRYSDDKYYALKVLSKAQIVNDSAVRQVKEESRIQQACGHHTFIVGAVARWQTKKRLYIVSEYVSGGELSALLERCGKLPEHIVKLLLAEIAIAIDFLHNAGVIYRDLKPENILLDSEGHAQLIDFGLSKWLSIGARTTTICGTLKYMAPEVVSRVPYGHAVDWWSMGVIACRMLTGEFPTPAVRRSLQEKPDEPSTASGHEGHGGLQMCPSAGSLPASSEDLSPAARGLLLRLLEREPRVRLRTLRQLEQTAFYMGFQFQKVRERNVHPRDLLEELSPGLLTPAAASTPSTDHIFENFDQSTTIY